MAVIIHVNKIDDHKACQVTQTQLTRDLVGGRRAVGRHPVAPGEHVRRQPGEFGPVALAVTTNCSIDFMRKPEAGRDLIARTRILKLGRVLVVGDVLITPEGGSAPVARAGMTYSIPPR